MKKKIPKKLNFFLKKKKCNLKVESLEGKFNRIETLKQELIDYYCEDALTFNLDDFLKIFFDLCNNINRAKEVRIILFNRK